MSWGTVESMWSRPTLEDGHEQAIRYGVVLDWRADRIARDAAATFAAGRVYPSRNRRTLADRDALGVETETSCLVSQTSRETPR